MSNDIIALDIVHTFLQDNSINFVVNIVSSEVSTEEEDGGTVKVVHFGVV